ncbi:MAG: N-acetyltransferase [Asticcacaulis sp.]
MDTLPFKRLIEPETRADAPQVERVVGRAFGPGRYTKTAERLRENSLPYADLSFVARHLPEKGGEGQLVASVRLWPVFIHNPVLETQTEVAFLGPIAVDPECQSKGIGRVLVEAALAAAFDKGLVAVLLVGTPAYFEKFGFAVAEALSLPGPVDYRRVMICYNPAYQGKSLTGTVRR